jgi:hypothetical protein
MFFRLKGPGYAVLAIPDAGTAFVPFWQNPTAMKRFYARINSAAVIAGLILFSSCALATDPVEREYKLAPFSSIYLEGPYKVMLIQGNSSRLVAEGDEPMLEELDVESSGGRLSVRFSEKPWKMKDYKITLRIYFRELEELEIQGAAEVRNEPSIRAGNLKVVFEGAGDVELDLRVSKLITDIDGVGNFVMSGDAEYHKVDFSGVGSYDGHNLLSKNTLVESNGVGSVKVHASEKFIGRANGIGSVEYYGEPPMVEVEASGLGKINRH